MNCAECKQPILADEPCVTDGSVVNGKLEITKSTHQKCIPELQVAIEKALEEFKERQKAAWSIVQEAAAEMETEEWKQSYRDAMDLLTNPGEVEQ